MTERIDHAAEARKLIAWGEEWMREQGSTDATNIATAMHAQTHATLALAEQARVANIISLSVKQGLSHDVEAWVSSWDEELNAEGKITKIELRPDIAAALGLTVEQEGGNDE